MYVFSLSFLKRVPSDHYFLFIKPKVKINNILILIVIYQVLEVIETKDKRGRRTVEYLIHFQGWNSSWDRCVSEDFVLKDTEENRQLQRDLAEKSQLQL